MTTNPLVSIILPCFNSHIYLPRAINSIRNQTYKNYEIIIVNDGSTSQETIDYLKSLPSDITVKHQENKGLPAARNFGFKEAKGVFIVPLDCDDWIGRDFISKCIAITRELNDKFHFVYSYISLEGEMSGILKTEFNYFEQLFTNKLPYCIFIRKTIWQDIGGYNETMRSGYEDWEFNLRLGSNGANPIVIREPLFHYYVSNTGMLASISRKKHGQLWKYIQECHSTQYKLYFLISAWKKWRHYPSSRNLFYYFIYYLVYKSIPIRMFNYIFSQMLFFSHSRIIHRSSISK